MSRIREFIKIELEQCLSKVGGALQFSENMIHEIADDPQADDEDRAMLREALVRIQRVRNGLHG